MMDDKINGLAARLAGHGAVTLTDDDRSLIVSSLAALGAAESRLALLERLLESYGHDARELLNDSGVALKLAAERFADHPAPGIDPEAHARARALLRERMEASATAAEWIGAVLDIVRLAIG